MPLVIVMLALLVQWARSDRRTARRLDRAADRDDDADLVAYNAMLAEMARRDTPGCIAATGGLIHSHGFLHRDTARRPFRPVLPRDPSVAASSMASGNGW